MGNEEDRGDEGEKVMRVRGWFFPMPHAQCPMPHAPC
ncbi:histidine kinase, partial [aff. Roholtiella sp. LEGE 12411]|nr:histidine kinase [aff. Roholtiella sp. LEGE 12411]